ncbi:MAG: hypothetical protein MMC23_000901 [Stictis urceolatum]|nr:hypothetical protein [Stictis urceolata]
MASATFWRLVCSALAIIPGVLGAAVTFSNSSTPAITSAPTSAAPPDPALIYDGTTYHKIFSDDNPLLSGINLTTARADWCSASSDAWTSEFLTAWTTSTITEPKFPTTGDWANLPTVPPVVTVTIPIATGGAQNPYICCGGCNINFYDVVVKFWPDPLANYDCLANQTATRDLLSAPSIIPRAEPTRRWAEPIITPGAVLRPRADGEPVSVVSDGYTYISPSVYISIPYAAAADVCGMPGSPKVSTILGFDPQAISTLGPTACSEVATNTFTKQICNVAKPFNPRDLPCAPASVTTLASSLWQQPDVYKPGWDYAPYVVLPDAIHNLDPNWKDCTAGPGHDPFTFLTPYDSLASPTTSAEPGSTPSASATPTKAPVFDPQPITTSGDPEATRESPPIPDTKPSSEPTSNPPPANPSPSKNPQEGSASTPSDPSPSENLLNGSGSAPADPPASSPDASSQPDPSNPSDPTENTSPGNDSSSPSQNPSDPSNPSSPHPSQVQGNPPDSSTEDTNSLAVASPTHFIPTVITTSINGKPTTFTSNVSVPAASPTSQVITTGGKTLSILPSGSGVVTDGSTIRPGSAITIHNTPISIGSTGSVVIIGSSIFSTPTPVSAAASQAPPAIAEDSHTFFPAPSSGGIVFDGSTLSAGQVVTVSGTPISVASTGGQIILGSSTISIPSAASASANYAPFSFQPAPPFTAAGETFSPVASGLVVGGSTIRAGEAVTVSGTVVSIASEGGEVVVVETSTVQLTRTTGGPDIGDVVISALGPGGMTSAGATAVGTGGAVIATGAAGRVEGGWVMVGVGMGVVLLGMVV